MRLQTKATIGIVTFPQLGNLRREISKITKIWCPLRNSIRIVGSFDLDPNLENRLAELPDTRFNSLSNINVVFDRISVTACRKQYIIGLESDDNRLKRLSKFFCNLYKEFGISCEKPIRFYITLATCSINNANIKEINRLLEDFSFEPISIPIENIQLFKQPGGLIRELKLCKRYDQRSSKQ